MFLIESMVKKFKIIFFNHYKYYTVDIALRYVPVVEEIKKRKIDNKKIAEIGSGSLGITPYLKKAITGVDISFKGEKTELLRKIKANAIKLPFKNNTFDCVLTLDMLEHLEQEQRKNAIYEMIRIANKILIIGFPSGEEAKKEDIYAKKRFFEVMGYNDKYLQEHIQYELPDINEIKALFRGKKIRILKNVNIHIHRLIINMQISKSKFKNIISSIIFVFIIPIFKLFNFGKCYRYILFIDLEK